MAVPAEETHLLSIAAIEASLSETGLADEFAMYAFYSLAVGVALQIASYVKYVGTNDQMPEVALDPPQPAIFSARTQRILAVVAIIIIIVSIGTTVYVSTATHGFNSLSIDVNYVNAQKEPAGVVVVAFAVTADGGVAPYNYSAAWPDGVVQVSATGAFSRAFSNETVPKSVSITIASSDGQKVTKSLSIPAASASSATSTSSSFSTSSNASTTSTNNSSVTKSTSVVTGKFPPLNLSVSFTSRLVEPDGNTTIVFGVSVTGGASPYNFVAVWADGVVQSSTGGTFSRTFIGGESIPTTAQVTVISGDDQNGTISITFGPGGS